MQTAYVYTSNYVRCRDNVVDFESYRRRMARRACVQSAEPLAAPAPAEARSARRRKKRAALYLDYCASAAIVAMAVAAAVRFLLL